MITNIFVQPKNKPNNILSNLFIKIKYTFMRDFLAYHHTFMSHFLAYHYTFMSHFLAYHHTFMRHFWYTTTLL